LLYSTPKEYPTKSNQPPKVEQIFSWFLSLLITKQQPWGVIGCRCSGHLALPRILFTMCIRLRSDIVQNYSMLRLMGQNLCACNVMLKRALDDHEGESVLWSNFFPPLHDSRANVRSLEGFLHCKGVMALKIQHSIWTFNKLADHASYQAVYV